MRRSCFNNNSLDSRLPDRNQLFSPRDSRRRRNFALFLGTATAGSISLASSLPRIPDLLRKAANNGMHNIEFSCRPESESKHLLLPRLSDNFHMPTWRTTATICYLPRFLESLFDSALPLFHLLLTKNLLVYTLCACPIYISFGMIARTSRTSIGMESHSRRHVQLSLMKKHD